MAPPYRQKWRVLGKVPPGTRVLCLFAHPDDIEGGCPNTVLKWVQAGAQVTFAVVTGGEYGLPRKHVRFYGKRLRAIRAREMLRVAKAYGTTVDGTPKIQLRWLGFIDGFVPVNHTIRRRIWNLIEETKPEILVTCDPYLVTDWHRDHRRTGYATLQVLRDIPAAQRPKLVLGLFSRESDFFVPYRLKEDVFDFFRIHGSQAGYSVHGWALEMADKFMHLFFWACHLNNKRKCGFFSEGFRLIPSPSEVPHVPPQLWRRLKYALTYKNYGPVKRTRYLPLPEELGLTRE